MSIETATPTDTTAPAAETTGRRAFAFREIALAVAIMAALFGALGYAAISETQADQATKRAAFENVLHMSSTELEGETVTELNGYRQDIKGAADYSLAFGNITGYDDAVVVHELDKVNTLILKKTDH